MESEHLVHVFLVSFPGQGHVNPLLRLAKRLASKGLLVTFSTTQHFGKQMQKATRINHDELSPVGDGFIRFEFFDDGWEEGDDPRRYDLDAYLVQLESAGKELLPRIITKHAERGRRPISCLINNPFIPWVSDVAESLGIPSAMLWVQSCACFASYYHYFHGLVPFPSEADPFIDVQLPAMPLLKHDEVPSFLHPSTPFPFLKRAILGQYKNLDKPFCILMDTFQDLEREIIDHVSKLCPIKTVGPLFKEADDSNIRGDMIEAAADCLEWLDSKPPLSVIYISLGSVVSLKKEQADEMAYGILSSGVSFLWVIRPPPKIFSEDSDGEFFVFEEEFLERAGERGRVVKWSPQERVLAHPSVACFVSHCGWNSSMEALASGIPVVAFPQWGDQVTNAKFLVEEFKVGLRLCRGEAENRLVGRDEVQKCLLEATVGPKSEEMKRNALKLKENAEASVAVGGSSDRNIQAFVDDVRRRSFALAGIRDSVSKSKPNGVAEI